MQTPLLTACLMAAALVIAVNLIHTPRPFYPGPKITIIKVKNINKIQDRLYQAGYW